MNSDQRSKKNYRKSSRWTRRERKTLLSVLREFGHEDISRIISYIPSRTKEEIAARLKKHEMSAIRKFRAMNRLQVQESFNHIHPWMPFINVYCNTEAQIHNYLVAYVLPIFERYATVPTAKFGAIDFKAAYRALFCALTMQNFPDDLSHETFSMIYASMKLLLKETADTKNESFQNELAKCLERHFSSLISNQNASGKNVDFLHLPEVNVLQLSIDELNELCRMKD